jgi:signal transduction histidine kinase/ActR/RegA family two-component response regulator
MRDSLTPKVVSNLAKTAQALAVLIMLVGAWNLWQWFFGSMGTQGLVTITMKTNTAFCFLLLGLSLLSVSRYSFHSFYTPAARIMLGVVLAIGFLTFLENIFGFDFGIDQLLGHEPPGAVGVLYPNRMGTPASLSFFLSAAGGLWLSFPGRGVKLSQLSGCAVFLVGLFAFMGYAYGVEPMYGLAKFTAIAFPTAMTLMMIGACLILARSGEGITAEFVTTVTGRKLTGSFLLPFFCIAFLTGYFKLFGEKMGFYDPATGTGLRTLLFIIFFSVMLYLNAKELNRRAVRQSEIEQNLRRKEEELLEAQRLTKIGHWWLDAATRAVNASREVYLIQGLDPSKPYPLFREENRGLYTLTQDSWDRASAAVQKALATGEGYEIDLESCHPNGTTIWFTARAKAVRDAEGRITGLRGTVQDITERKKTEEALKNWTIELEKRVEERTQLLEEQTVRLRQLAVELTEVEQSERRRLAEVLHDHLQQYLVAAKMRIEVSERKVSENERSGLQDARSYIEKAAEASRMLTAELRPPVLYEGGLGAALRYLTKKIAEQHNMRVNLLIGPDTEPGTDFIKIMVYQCVQELLFNTVKYAQVQECFLRLERGSNRTIQATVEDKGVGFDPADIGRKGSGGFGLFSIRERVKALDGELQISSMPGYGSQFKIIVPDRVEIPSAKNLPAVDVLIRERSKEERGNMVVLVADDHQIIRQSLASLLKSQPFVKEVVEAENGEEAVKIAQAIDPDVILMDLNMPKMNGIEATRILHSRNPHIKIIGLSVQAERETAQAMKDVGAAAYFNKADDTNALIETIKNFAQACYGVR